MIAPLRRGSRLAGEWVVVLVLSLASLILLSLTGLDERWNFVAYDAMVRAGAGGGRSAAYQSSAQDVLIVAIDKRALDEIGPWPWPRSVHAKLLNKIKSGGARLVLLDILFPEPSPDDQILAKAMAEAGNVGVPYRIETPAPNGAPYELEAPVPVVAQAAATSGHAMVAPDSDGVVRRIDRIYRVAGGIWPHVAIASAHRFPLSSQNAADNTNVSHDGFSKPQDEPGLVSTSNTPNELVISGPEQALLAFAAPPDGLPTISAAAIMRDEVPRELIEGRDVMIGSMAAGLGDYFATPFGRDRQMMRGVELSANVLLAERNNAWITPLNPLWGILMFGPVMLITLLAFVRVRAQAALILTVAAIATIFAISGILLYNGYWLGPVGAAVIMALAGLAWAWRRLALVDDVLGEELARLGAYPSGPPSIQQNLALAFSDPLNERIGLLRQTLSRMRDVTLSLEQVIDNLPDPTLVINSNGEVIRANRGMVALSMELAQQAGAAAQPMGESQDASENDHQNLVSVETDAALPQSYSDLQRLFSKVGAKKILQLPDPSALASENGGAHSTEPLELTTEDQRHFLAASEQVPGRGVAIVSFVEITALRRAMRERERALQFLSHDLRAPIAAGISYLGRIQGAQGSADKSNTQQNATLVGEARRHMQRALELASSYVLLVKAEEAEANSVTFDVTDCLDEAMDTLWPMARENKATIRADFPDREVLVYGDRSAILRCIENLLRNAIEHSGPKNQEIALTLSERTDMVTISVIDRDCATAEQITGAIDSYRQSGNFGAGVGLGLAYCVAVARRHGGSITVEARDEGKAVSLVLPKAQA